jgi:glycosyltransferase involved in cell wall biosynthesis
VAIAEGTGLSCVLLGRGVPLPFPEPAAERDIDVLMLARSHWPDISRRLVEALEAAGLGVATLPVSGHSEVLEALGRARILVHPARAEANSRIVSEARAMGAVPVLVGSNPFAAGVDEQHGALPVGSFDELPAAVTQLLADPPRLELLSARGRGTARDELAWEPYVERVDRALSSPAAARDPGRAARAGLGAALSADGLAAANAAADLARHREWLDATNASLSWRLTAPLRAAKRRVRGSPRSSRH